MSIPGFSMVGIPKMMLVFLLGYSQTILPPQDPQRVPSGGGGGALSPLHKKTCDILILGFSNVRISKMTSVFLLGYPQTLVPPPWRPPGDGGRIFVLYHKKTRDMTNLGFSMMGISKIMLVFLLILRYP